jgi:hypothetical protein
MFGKEAVAVRPHVFFSESTNRTSMKFASGKRALRLSDNCFDPYRLMGNL